MNIDLQSLGFAFELMWQGMLGIFAVMAVISVIVSFSTKIGKKK